MQQQRLVLLKPWAVTPWKTPAAVGSKVIPELLCLLCSNLGAWYDGGALDPSGRGQQVAQSHASPWTDDAASFLSTA